MLEAKIYIKLILNLDFINISYLFTIKEYFRYDSSWVDAADKVFDETLWHSFTNFFRLKLRREESIHAVKFKMSSFT